MDGEAIDTIVATAREAAAFHEKPFEVAGHGFHKLVIPRTTEQQSGWVTEDLPVVPAAALRPDTLSLHTLTGLVEYVKENREGLALKDCLIHVVDHRIVKLLSRFATKEGELQTRTVYVQTAFETLIGGEAFKFGNYMDAESFNVALQTLFEDDEQRAAVLATVGNMREETAQKFDDDGVTQAVTAAHGVSLGRIKPVPNPVTLRPFRTFREVEQPASKFVLRVKGGGQGTMPTCALFEADGGAWKLSAIKAVAEYLRAQIPVDAALPIIA